MIRFFVLFLVAIFTISGSSAFSQGAPANEFHKEKLNILFFQLASMPIFDNFKPTSPKEWRKLKKRKEDIQNQGNFFVAETPNVDTLSGRSYNLNIGQDANLNPTYAVVCTLQKGMQYDICYNSNVKEALVISYSMKPQKIEDGFIKYSLKEFEAQYWPINMVDKEGNLPPELWVKESNEIPLLFLKDLITILKYSQKGFVNMVLVK